MSERNLPRASKYRVFMLCAPMRGVTVGAARVPFAAASVGGHAMACPMRVWLLVISGIVAAYLAWTSSLFAGAALDEG